METKNYSNILEYSELRENHSGITLAFDFERVTLLYLLRENHSGITLAGIDGMLFQALWALRGWFESISCYQYLLPVVQ